MFACSLLLSARRAQFEPLFNQRVRRQASHRLKICEEEESHHAIEQRIWYGQIEELIQQAEEELDLVVLMNEDVKPWVEDPAFKAESEAIAMPNFGETEEQMRASMKGQKPKAWSEAEQTALKNFWKELDDEIAQDQQREAEERAARKAKKQ